MNRSRLLIGAFITAIGATDLLAPTQLDAKSAASLSCFLCVPPPIMCDGPYEWDDECESTCQTLQALTCPFEDNRCAMNTWIVICEGS